MPFTMTNTQLIFVHKMKKILLMLMLMFSLSMSAQSSLVGNRYFEPEKKGKYMETPYYYTDKNGIDWGKISINTENGRCKVSRTKPDGKKTSKYLSEADSKDVCRKMNITYTYTPKKK